jgi:uncharacterized protein (DUF58 family)
MTVAPTARVSLYAALSGVTLVLAITSRRPELAVMGLPFAVVLVWGLATAPTAALRLTLACNERLAIEGEELDVIVTIASSDRASTERSPWVEVVVHLPLGLTPLDPPAAFVCSVAPGAPTVRSVPVRCDRWGNHRVRATVTSYDGFRLFVRRRDVEAAPVRVHPRTEHLRSLVRPARLLGLAGSHVSRTRAEGIEYADARPFVPGDRMRSVNWRLSARRDSLWVGERHPDRNADVVVFIDLFAAAGTALDSTLDVTVRAVAAIGEAHLAANDRVGLVGLGGVLRWLAPGMGDRQLHAVVDAVLDSAVIASDAPKDLDVIPVRGLPPRALVVALSPLLDTRAAALFHQVCGRGFDLVVVECSPLGFAAPGPDAAALAAHRMWRLERAVARDQLIATGAVVVEWERGRPFAEVLHQIRTWRRVPRLVAR